MIPNNAFSSDAVDVRRERLDLIEQNIATYLADLTELDDGVDTWAATCYTQFDALRSVIGTSEGHAEGAAVVNTAAFAAMNSEYQILRRVAKQRFKHTPERLNGYKFHLAYPRTQEGQLERIKIVLDEHALTVAAAMTPLLPAEVITRLQAAYTSAMTKEDLSDEKDSALRHNRVTYDARWNSDEDMLEALYTACLITYGDDHVMLNDLGFRRRSQLGQPGGGNPPDATTITSYANGELTAAEVEDATSYEWQESADTNTWPADWTNLSTPTWTVGLPTTANRYFRVRTRNVHGVSAVSPVFVVPAGAGFGAPTGLAHNFATGLTSWDAVAPAAPGEEVQYELHFRPTGSPTSNQIGITTDTFYANWPISGGTLMVRAMSGGQTSGWTELDV